ncbi:MAG: hypothetical protein IJ525_05890 [Alphaproteobacteria bacterium]|nr:hypothetical protein [Alphaproteobacteria bacterium]
MVYLWNIQRALNMLHSLQKKTNKVCKNILKAAFSAIIIRNWELI